MNVLITSAGRRVSLLESFQRDARDLDGVGDVFACDLKPELSSACYRADGSFAVPRVDAPDYLDALTEECRRRDISMIVPTIDTELPVLAAHRESLAGLGIHVCVSDSSFVEAAGDKTLTPSLMTERGIPTPHAMPANELEFPTFVKPRFGSSSQDVLIARSAEDLAPRHLSGDDFIFQEYMDPSEYDEVTVDLYYDRASHLKCLVPRLRIETRAGEVSKGRTIRDGVYDFLRDRIATWPGARGCVTLQVFAGRARDSVFAIEVNPRFGGGFPLSHAAGARFPLWLMREYLSDESVDFFDGWEQDLLMLRYDQGVFVSAT